MLEKRGENRLGWAPGAARTRIAPKPMSRVQRLEKAHHPCTGWFLMLVVLAHEASAQNTEANVVTASADAFGVSIGVEALGVYSPSQVRGFDPLADGNGRI